jgi:hypothetical protein
MKFVQDLISDGAGRKREGMSVAEGEMLKVAFVFEEDCFYEILCRNDLNI